MSNIRKLPLPSWFNDVRQGVCRWCNCSIGLTPSGRESKATWHAHCVKEYRFLHWPSEQRRVVARRDRHICATCGVNCRGAWDLDHIRPLWESGGDPSFWQLSNMQTLCRPCHKVKTSLEAKRRAATRKAEMEKLV